VILTGWPAGPLRVTVGVARQPGATLSGTGARVCTADRSWLGVVTAVSAASTGGVVVVPTCISSVRCKARWRTGRNERTIQSKSYHFVGTTHSEYAVLIDTKVERRSSDETTLEKLGVVFQGVSFERQTLPINRNIQLLVQ